jgi:mRNA interferase MazF
MRYSRNHLVLLPIPFTDLSSNKVRPAVVIGLGSFESDLFVVPVTSRMFQTDLILRDWAQAGLNVQSGVKGQIATVDRSLIRQVLGTLSTSDTARLDLKLREWLAL